jgi:UDP-galactopyranose mutase
MVSAGLSGTILARSLAGADHAVTIADARPPIAGTPVPRFYKAPL